MGLCCIANVLSVFSASAPIILVEITGVTGCLGLELGLGCLTVFSAVASPGFADTIGVKSWLGLGLLGDVTIGLVLLGVATCIGLVLLFGRVGDVAVGLAFFGVAT